MFNNYQKTIKNPISCFGVGVHSGLGVSMRFLPAPVDHGIEFHRIDITDKPNTIKAAYNTVTNTFLCTTISNNVGVKVSTVEHVMAALWGCGIDNLIIEVDGAEIPIMDGSSEPFVFMIECAGLSEQTKKRRIIEVLKPVNISDGEAYVSVVPAKQFSITMEIEFNNSRLIAKQFCSFDEQNLFKNDISRARTFGFAEDIEKLRAAGLGLGGSLDNVVVVQNDTVLNKDGLRYQDEFVRHKVLDSIGDFYLAGGYIQGHFQAKRSGHSLNNKLLHEIFSDPNAWRVNVA